MGFFAGPLNNKFGNSKYGLVAKIICLPEQKIVQKMEYTFMDYLLKVHDGTLKMQF